MTFGDGSTGLRANALTPDEQHLELHRNGVTFTPATPNDIAAITAMFTRSSPQSRLRRFFRLVPSVPLGYLETVLADRDKHHVIVIRRNGETVGLAELHLTGPWSGDLAVAVEDSFQRQGLGSTALELLMSRAHKLGLRSLSADVQLENSHVIEGLRRLGPVSMHRTHDVLHVELDLEAAAMEQEPSQIRRAS